MSVACEDRQRDEMQNTHVASSSTKTTLSQVDAKIPMSDNTFYASLCINV